MHTITYTHTHTHIQALIKCDIKNSLSIKEKGISPPVSFEPGQTPANRPLEKRMGKLMTTMTRVFAFFSGLEKKLTKNKACDKLHYLVALQVRRQLLLER